MFLAIEEIIARLKQAGIIALLPGVLPLHAVCPLADALLAAPVLAVEVVVTRGVKSHGGSDNLIADLRQRAGNHMLVGAGGVDTAEEVDAVVAAGAQFVTSTRFETTVMASCQASNVLYLPGVISLMAAQAAYRAGCRLVQLTTGGPGGPAYLKTLRASIPELDVIVTGKLVETDATKYAQAGAMAIAVGEALFAGPPQPMVEVIVNARAWQRAWEQGAGSGEWRAGSNGARRI
jgi:2-dehydro-3-deoxyphosphogluconate aldolase/(4S)-4-hydroxy-2-oxoglutarate aldolase